MDKVRTITKTKTLDEIKRLVKEKRREVSDLEIYEDYDTVVSTNYYEVVNPPPSINRYTYEWHHENAYGFCRKCKKKGERFHKRLNFNNSNYHIKTLELKFLKHILIDH